MPSLTPSYRSGLAFSGKQAAAMAALSGFRGRQELFTRQTPERLEALRESAIVQSAESSSRIEGVVAASGRVEALVRQNSTPRNRPEQEITGCRDALSYIHEDPAALPFSEHVIRQLHSMLFRYTSEPAGQWKLADNLITDKDRDGNVSRIRFRPTAAAGTAAAMGDLVAAYRVAVQSGEDPLIVVPLAVLDFLCVHPFADGNGRVARLLTLLLLYHAGFEVGRYVSLERIVEESKESYYETLELASQGWHESEHDVMPWVEYLWGVITRAYKDFEERVGSLPAGRGSKTQMIRDAVGRRIRPFAISEIERDCPGVSRPMVRKVLEDLRTEDVIELRGRGRAARYHKKGL